MSDSPIAVRVANQGDLVFVRTSWLQSFWHNWARPVGMSAEAYNAGYTHHIDRLLDASTINVVYAVSYPTEIIGYSVMSKDVVHYCYVKKDFRRQGLATSLVAGIKQTSSPTFKGTVAHKFNKALNIAFKPKLGEL